MLIFRCLLEEKLKLLIGLLGCWAQTKSFHLRFAKFLKILEQNFTYHNNISDKAGTRGEQVTLLLSQGLEIEAHSLQKIAGLANIHPESVELHAVQFTFVCHHGKDLFLDACWSKLE